MRGAASNRDRLGARWARRCVTVPAWGAMFVAVTVGLPGLLPAALVFDLARRKRDFHAVRLAMFGWCYLFTEMLGLALLLVTYLVTLGRPSARQRLTWLVQTRYAAAHWAFVSWAFALSSSVEGAEALGRGPLVVLMRHASLVDVLLPAVFVAAPGRLRLRYVLKRELLWEPCLDIAGHWIPNHFVARGRADTAADVAGVGALKAGLGENDGVLLFPEGTRFNANRRLRVVASLPEGSPQRASAERLTHLLPIRPGGALALLSAAPACDLLFVGHHGLEGFSHLSDILAGGLAGRTVRLRFWREAAASIPQGTEARRAWLEEKWERVDAWLRGLEGCGA